MTDTKSVKAWLCEANTFRGWVPRVYLQKLDDQEGFLRNWQPLYLDGDCPTCEMLETKHAHEIHLLEHEMKLVRARNERLEAGVES